MNRYAVYGWLALASLLAVSCATDGDRDAAAPDVDLQAATPHDAAPSDGEMVQVHGQWRLDVRNADGSMDQVVEFENALLGADVLALLLGRERTTGLWTVELSSHTFGDDGITLLQPCGAPDLPRTCWITETESTDSSGGETEVFKNLTLDVQVADLFSSSGTSLVLSGQATMASETTIDEVGSWVKLCAATVTATECSATDGGDLHRFTGTDAFDAVSVSPGQAVTITVTLSFE